MQDRQYQGEQILETFSALEANRKVCVQLPTGGGKTVEFAFICRRYTIDNPGKSVLILVHRKELLQQAAETISSIMGIIPVLITSKSKVFSISRVYIGMIDSTMSRVDLLYNVGMVIIDECHDAHFNKAHDEFLNQLVIGFSATPISSSKKDPLNNYYSALITGPQIKDLITAGFLSQNLTRVPENHIDSSKFAIDNRKGDYNENQMAMEYKMPKNVNNVVKQYHKFCRGKKTIIFNVNIEHSKEVTELFLHCGLPCKHLDSNSKDRDQILKWFAETEDAILCNVMIATVGFDEPTILNVIINFSTLSIVKYLQCCGRGGRIIDEWFIEKNQWQYPYPLSTKKYFNILDLGGNYSRFGEWNDDRDWRYIFDNPEKPNDGIAPVKTCPDCLCLVHASSSVCLMPKEDGNYCGHEFPKRVEMEEQDLEEMVLITKGIDVNELIGKNKRKFEYFTFLDMAHDVVKRMYANKAKDTDKYFKAYYNLCCEWWKKEMAGKNGNKASIEDSSWHIRLAKSNFDKLCEKHKSVIFDKCEDCEGLFDINELVNYEGFQLCEKCQKSQEEFTSTEYRINRGY